jgi:hypothetical protein
VTPACSIVSIHKRHKAPRFGLKDDLRKSSVFQDNLNKRAHGFRRNGFPSPEDPVKASVSQQFFRAGPGATDIGAPAWITAAIISHQTVFRTDHKTDKLTLVPLFST